MSTYLQVKTLTAYLQDVLFQKHKFTSPFNPKNDMSTSEIEQPAA